MIFTILRRSLSTTRAGALLCAKNSSCIKRHCGRKLFCAGFWHTRAADLLNSSGDVREFSDFGIVFSPGAHP